MPTDAETTTTQNRREHGVLPLEVLLPVGSVIQLEDTAHVRGLPAAVRWCLCSSDEGGLTSPLPCLCFSSAHALACTPSTFLCPRPGEVRVSGPSELSINSAGT